MKPFDLNDFRSRVRQALDAGDLQGIVALDGELDQVLKQSSRLNPPEISSLRTLYQQLLSEIGRAMQQSELELAQYLQQHEQRSAYASFSAMGDEA